MTNPTVFNIHLDDGTVMIKGAESQFWTGIIIPDHQAILLTLHDHSDFIPYLTSPLLCNVNYSTTDPTGYHIKISPDGDALSNLSLVLTVKENTNPTTITNQPLGKFASPFALVRNATSWIMI